MKRQTVFWIVFLLLVSRTGFAVFFQGAFSLGSTLAGEEINFLNAGRWWTVYGSLIDLGCFVILRRVLRHEGTGIKSVIAFSAEKLKRDMKHAGLLFLALIPLTMLWGTAVSFLIYGQPSTPILAGPLPAWGVWYSILIWPIGWAIMEQAVYMGYCLPRLERALKSKTAAVTIVMIFWALQHVALPVTLDAEYALYRLLTVVPMTIIPIYYLKTRRLVPLIMVHAIFDIFSAVSFYYLVP